MNGAWGSVCDSGGDFTTDEATVACRQLEVLQGELYANIRIIRCLLDRPL